MVVRNKVESSCNITGAPLEAPWIEKSRRLGKLQSKCAFFLDPPMVICLKPLQRQDMYLEAKA